MTAPAAPLTTLEERDFVRPQRTVLAAAVGAALRRGVAPARDPEEDDREQGSLLLDVLLGLVILALIALIAVSAAGQYRSRAYEQSAMSDAQSLGMTMTALTDDGPLDPYQDGDVVSVGSDQVTLSHDGNNRPVDFGLVDGEFGFCVVHDDTEWARYASDEGGLVQSGRSDPPADCAVEDDGDDESEDEGDDSDSGSGDDGDDPDPDTPTDPEPAPRVVTWAVSTGDSSDEWPATQAFQGGGSYSAVWTIRAQCVSGSACPHLDLATDLADAGFNVVSVDSSTATVVGELTWPTIRSVLRLIEEPSNLYNVLGYQATPDCSWSSARWMCA